MLTSDCRSSLPTITATVCEELCDEHLTEAHQAYRTDMLWIAYMATLHGYDRTDEVKRLTDCTTLLHQEIQTRRLAAQTIAAATALLEQTQTRKDQR
jgi:hypothetical protein